MQNSTTGSGNTAVGYAAQSGGITTGTNNVSVGNGAGNDLTTEVKCICG